MLKYYLKANSYKEMWVYIRNQGEGKNLFSAWCFRVVVTTFLLVPAPTNWSPAILLHNSALTSSQNRLQQTKHSPQLSQQLFFFSTVKTSEDRASSESRAFQPMCLSVTDYSGPFQVSLFHPITSIWMGFWSNLRVKDYCQRLRLY